MKEFLVRNKWSLLIAVLAFGVRAVYLLQLNQQPGFEVPMIDEKWHWEWAQNILNDSFWGHDAYFRGPLYPYLLAFFAGITGSSVFWSKMLQLLIAGGTAALVFKTGEKLFDRNTGILAGIIYAFYGTLIYYEAAFLIPVLFLLLVVWAMYRVIAFRDSLSVRTWLVTGLIFGLAAISRPNVLLTIPFLMVWLFFTVNSDRSFLKRARLPFIMLAGILIAVIPVTVRNVIVTGDLILISSQGGVNLYLGNNTTADGLTMVMPEVDLDESVSWRQFGTVTRAAAEREAGRELSESEQSSFWTGKAIDFVVHNPGKFLGLVWRKTVYLVSGFENSDNADLYYHRDKSTLYSLLFWGGKVYFPFGLLLPLTLVGIYIHRHRLRDLAPVYIFILAYIPSIVLFLVTARHRLPLIPFMVILAAGGLTALVSRRRQLSGRQWGIILAVFTIPLVLLNGRYYDEDVASVGFQNYFNDGIMYERMDDLENAEQAYLAADRSYSFSPTLINNLGHVQYRLGKPAAADSNYHRAIRLDPDFPGPYNNLGLLVYDAGRLDSAHALFRAALDRYDSATADSKDVGQTYIHLADVFEDMGLIDSSAIAHEMSITAAPEWGKPYFQAAAFYSRHGRHEVVDDLYDRGMHYLGLSEVEYFNWGLSFLARKQLTVGISKMLMALKMDREMHQAWYCIAAAYLEGGEPPDSVVALLDKCLAIDSTYGPARQMKQTLLENKK